MTIPYVTSFSDDFNDATSLLALFPADGSRWTGWERKPTQSINDATLVSDGLGGRLMKFVAQASVRPYPDGLSKMEIKKQNFAFKAGMTVEILARYYLVGTKPADGLLLCDLEGPPDSEGEPGIRLILVGGSGEYLAVDRSKFGQPTIYQPSPILFPRNAWVRLRWRIALSQGQDGAIWLFQEDAALLHAANVQTMPPANMTNGVYDDLQVGITANGYQSDAIVGVDNVSIAAV